MIEIDITKPLHGVSGEMLLEAKLTIAEGDFVALAGESGSGKTTLLRILAGLEHAEGTIEVSGETWQEKSFHMPPQKRGIGFVFQDYALFENMSVIENLLFVQKDNVLAKHLLEIVELSELSHRRITTLSGGQKQRVSLARAMMKRPKLLLLDEPLSALDPSMRTKLQQEILTLHKEFGTTTLMVSHDPSEIYRLANRVVMLEKGRIKSEGTPKEVLLQRSSSQKFSFTGELLEIVEVDVIKVAVIAIGQQLVEVVIGEEEARNLKIGQSVRVGTKAFAPIINHV
ncbi:MAG: ATP-binding cassette domain-containing protein [Epsilonproteobacteria bacterium]|nr:ATP-binding cassette domain-containing protein [Campylobacterota bacterium]